MIMTKDSYGNYVEVEDIKQQDSFNGISPIEFKSSGNNLENYRIYGNAISGEGVGDRTWNLFDNSITIENGTVNSETGADSSYQSQKRLRTSFIGFLSAGTYTINVDGVDRINCIALYSSQNVNDFIETVSSTALTPKSFTLNEGGYIRVAFSRANSSDISPSDISNIMLNVGSEALPYEPCGYKVPVKVEGKNKWSSQVEQGIVATSGLYGNSSIRLRSKNIPVISGQKYTVSSNLVFRLVYAYYNDTPVQKIYDASSNKNSITITIPNTANNISICLRNSDGTDITPNDFQWGQIEEGETTTAYELYHAPVTTTLYLPEQIKKVGDEVEYIDFKEQKQRFSDGTSIDVVLPALPTLSGTNTLSVNTNIKPSKVWGELGNPRDILYVKDNLGNTLFSKYYEIEDKSPLTYKAKKTGSLKNYRIYGNTVNGESVGNIAHNNYTLPIKVGRKAAHTATLQLHDCLDTTLQFDSPEALYYAKDGLAAGIYNFTINKYDMAHGGNKTYQFTLANPVPAGGQLTFEWKYNTQAIDTKIVSYASASSLTPIEQVSVSQGNSGTYLGITDGTSENVNHIFKIRYGSNNYIESAIRQYLNSGAAAGNVWHPFSTNKYDRPPSWVSTIDGFLCNFENSFLQSIGLTSKAVTLNPITDSGESTTIKNEKFFLLSRAEVYGGGENDVNEGSPYLYYSNNSDLSSAGIESDNNRKKYKNNVAQGWGLRTVNTSNAYSFYSVSNTGAVTSTSASTKTGICPACNIELNENYAYNGTVLHIGDQISIGSGNNTFIFDIIDIDHDTVEFDVTNYEISMSEPIKMVGDEAEYIDFKKQKQYRIRKNYVDLNNIIYYGTNPYVDNGVLILPASQTQTQIAKIAIPELNEDTTFTVSFDAVVSENTTATFYFDGYPDSANEDTSLGADTLITVNSTSTHYSYSGVLGAGTDSIRFFRTDTNINYDTSIISISNIQLELGNVETTYEPYIANTELSIVLPSIPILSGTNILSVETEVQPSNIYLKGKIEKKPKIYYYSQDGQTLLYTESVLKGNSGIYSDIPTKIADAQYTYTFAGWADSIGQTTATLGVRDNIQGNKNVYAAFSQTLNTYTVYFYNGETLLQTTPNVAYGGSATYSGTAPIKTAPSTKEYIFTGWNPSPINIQGNTICYAQFVELTQTITDSWEEILENVTNGTYTSKYVVGDTKIIDLGTEGKVAMEIVGMDTDDLSDNSGKAPITWISKQLLNTNHRMNPSYSSGTEGTGTLGGWEKTEMRSYLKETVKPLIPETVRNAIKLVKKYSRIYNVSGLEISNVLTTDDVWIPSRQEVFGNYSSESSGVYYSSAFPDDTSRIKSKGSSSAAWWWLRSASSTSTVDSVRTDGARNGNNAGNTGGIALGFCT